MSGRFKGLLPFILFLVAGLLFLANGIKYYFEENTTEAILNFVTVMIFLGMAIFNLRKIIVNY